MFSHVISGKYKYSYLGFNISKKQTLVEDGFSSTFKKGGGASMLG